MWWSFEGTYSREDTAGSLEGRASGHFPRPGDLNLSPRHLISGEELREALKSGYRHKGRASDGVWMRDMYPDGSGLHYWKGRQTSTTTSKIEGDMEYTERSNGKKTRCTFYRNPEGTKEKPERVHIRLRPRHLSLRRISPAVVSATFAVLAGRNLVGTQARSSWRLRPLM